MPPNRIPQFRRILKSGIAFWTSILIASLGIHIGVVATDPNFFLPPKPIGDGAEYECIGYGLISGRGFWLDTGDSGWREIYEGAGESHAAVLEMPTRTMPAVHRPPVLPFLIAGTYSILGRNELGFAGVRVILACCSGLACFFACRMAKRVGEVTLSGVAIICSVVAAFALSAVNRTLHSYATDFLTEPIALLLFQLFAMAVLRWLDLGVELRKRRLLVMTSAALFSALILTRSIFVLWLPLLVPLICFVDTQAIRIRIKESALFGSCVVLLCLPWWIHNCVATSALMPLGTQGPITLVGGYSDEALSQHGDWSFVPELRLRQTVSDKLFASDIDREKYLASESTSQVLAWIGKNARSLPKLVVERAATHWNPYTGKSLIWKVLIALGLLILLRRDFRVACWLLGLFAISTLVTCCLYSVGGRFLVPLYGIQFMAAGIACGFIFDYLLRQFRMRIRHNEVVS